MAFYRVSRSSTRELTGDDSVYIQADSLVKAAHIVERNYSFYANNPDTFFTVSPEDPHAEDAGLAANVFKPEYRAETTYEELI